VNAAYWTHYFGTSVPQFLMPYAVNNDYFAELAAAAAPHEQELRAELGLSPERPGNLVRLQAPAAQTCGSPAGGLSPLHRRHAPAQRPYLVMVGDGEQRAQLEAQAQNLRLEDVRFAGFRNQSELPRFFQLADVFVLPRATSRGA
jgi:hypothetical protein